METKWLKFGENSIATKGHYSSISELLDCSLHPGFCPPKKGPNSSNYTLNGGHLFSAFETMDVTFSLGQEYQLSTFLNQIVMHNRCIQPKPNTLFFHSYEPTKKWNITTEMVFSELGMVAHQTFLDDHISAKKFYTKTADNTHVTFF